MILCYDNYRNFVFNDFKDHVEAVNLNFYYCSNLDNPMEYLFKCKCWELPSFHPYWKERAKKGTRDFIKNIKNEIQDNRRLLELNPSHYYRNNILSNIGRLETILQEHETTKRT